MERFSKEHFKKVGYETLIKNGMSHKEIADNFCREIFDVPVWGKTISESYLVRTDTHWLENVGRNALGFPLLQESIHKL